MMRDLADHPFSPENITRESGIPDQTERAWFRFVKECEHLLGHSLDGCDDFTARANNIGCGYSLDEAHEAFEACDSAAQYVARVQRRDRYDHGALT